MDFVRKFMTRNFILNQNYDFKTVLITMVTVQVGNIIKGKNFKNIIKWKYVNSFVIKRLQPYICAKIVFMVLQGLMD